MRTNAWIFALLLAFCLAPVFSGGQEKVASYEAEAREIETLLIAPCCWRQPISDHQSEIAGEMKDDIRKMLDEGKQRQEILDFYVDQYGARILSIPPQEGFNRMSFLMPVFFVLAGLVVVGLLLKKWGAARHTAVAAPAGAGAPTAPPALDDEMSRRIQKELDEMDNI
jgi:cytochrome c-type biogenesis protein CcmH